MILKKRCWKMDSKEYSDRSFLITNINDGTKTVIEPTAVEKCMEPGQFYITPVEVTTDGIKRIYRSRDCVLQVEEKQLACGDVIVEEKPFVPKTVRKKGGCTTCVNCGRC